MDEAVLLRAIYALKDELIVIINTGISQVQASVSQLQAQQTSHMLEQEKRNGTFATRERVESLSTQVAHNSNEITRLHQRDDESSTDRSQLRADLIALERSETRTHIDNLNKGYVAIGTTALAVIAVLAQFFFHFWR